MRARDVLRVRFNSVLELQSRIVRDSERFNIVHDLRRWGLHVFKRRDNVRGLRCRHLCHRYRLSTLFNVRELLIRNLPTE